MQIQRQAEQYGEFEKRLPGTPPEPRTAAPESRAVKDLLKGVAIPLGLNNTRQASRRTAGGWNYFEDSPSPRAHWNHGPGDYGDDRPSLSDLYADEPYQMSDEEFDAEGYHEPSANPEDDRYIDPGFREAAAAVQTPAPVATFGQVPTMPGHGFVRGHRVGLPYGDGVIKGVVTHLDGENVGVRWDDGQNSKESPWDIHPL